MLTCDSVNNTLRESAFSETTAKCSEGKPFCGAGGKKPHTVHAVMCHDVRTGGTVMLITKAQEWLGTYFRHIQSLAHTRLLVKTVPNWLMCANCFISLVKQARKQPHTSGTLISVF